MQKNNKNIKIFFSLCKSEFIFEKFNSKQFIAKKQQKIFLEAVKNNLQSEKWSARTCIHIAHQEQISGSLKSKWYRFFFPFVILDENWGFDWTICAHAFGGAGH